MAVMMDLAQPQLAAVAVADQEHLAAFRRTHPAL